MGRKAIDTKEEAKERHKARKKQCYLDNPKKQIICCWKLRGLQDDFEMVYKRYYDSTHCELCGIKYGKIGDGGGRFKAMDHDHLKLTNNFRNILCHKCNVTRDMPLPLSGHRNIMKHGNGWQYRARSGGPNEHSKWFKYRNDAVVYKYLYEAFNPS